MKKVIKASAGTGKTYRLSLEYLAALLKDIDFSEIIVMTFTKKATAEIKNRILSHLRAIINQSPESKTIISSLKDVYPEIKIERAELEKIYKKMILNDEDIKIYTIDAFTNQIFARGIAPYLALYNYQIIDQNQNEEIIEELLKKILNNQDYYQKMQKFFEANTARDLEPYLKFIKNIVDNAWKFMLLKQNKSTKKKLAEGNLSVLFEDSYQTLAEVAALRGESLSPAYFVKDGRVFFEQYSDLKTKAEKTKFLYKRRDYLLNNTYWNGNKLRAKKTAELKQSLESKYQLFREKLAVRIYNKKVIPMEKEIINFADLVLELYDQLKFKREKFTHSDISNYTFKYLADPKISLIESGEASDYLLDLLGGEYKALFIDEFQDTSILQWKILKPLIKKAEDFIAVGDEKQSIYGWRGGEKKLFASLDKIINAETERLERCYRSDQNIIKFLNDFFSEPEVDWEYHAVKADSKNNGLTEVVYGGSSAHYKTTTKTFARLSEKKQEQIEEINSKIKVDLAAEIAADINEHYSGDYGRVSVLARTAKELNEIAAELNKKEVPYILENRKSLLEANLPAAIYDFLYFAAYRDFYSLLKFLRSDLIKIDHQKLKLILNNQSDLKRYFNEKDKIEFPAAVIEEKRLAKTFKEIKRLINQDYEQIVNYLYQKTELLDLAADNSLVLKNLYAFFKILNSFSSLKDILNYLAENRESEELKQKKVENNEAVTLMTIHQSKGLSLPVEYYYWSPGRRGGNNSGGLNFYLDFDDNYDSLNNYLFIQDQYLSILDLLDYNFKEKEDKKEEMEEINNLYVALSRAENDLHLYLEAPRKIKIDKDLMWSGSNYEYYEKMLLQAVQADNLIDLLEGEIKGSHLTAENNFDRSDFKLAPLNKYFKQTKRKIKSEKNNKYRYFQQQSSGQNTAEKKLKGLAVHYYLENIKYNTAAERNSASKLLKSKYGNLLGREKIKTVITKAKEFIKNNKNIFSDEYQVFNEYLLKEKTKTGEKHYRIDRLVVDRENKKIKILDYKTGSYRDQSQLDKYQEILASQLDNSWQLEAKFLSVEL